MSKVTPIGGVTKLDIDADQILENNKGKLDKVILIGLDHDGYEYFVSSMADGGEALWLMERFKKQLLEVSDWYEG